jgi:hypothetical protein
MFNKRNCTVSISFGAKPGLIIAKPTCYGCNISSDESYTTEYCTFEILGYHDPSKVDEGAEWAREALDDVAKLEDVMEPPKKKCDGDCKCKGE